MASTLTPNMNLILPTVGQEQGPTYATDVNNSLSLVDQHDHSPGQGVPITPAGITISTDLSFLQNNATNLRSVRFFPQSSTLSGPSDLGCLYENGVDLYYNDGSGNIVRITQGGSVAGASGSITGLTSPASVVFSPLSGIFTFQSDTNVAGGMDFGPFTVRDTAASANGITIASPVALAANYSITLLPALPGSTLPLSISNSGALSAAQITGSQIGTNTIAAASIVNNSITDTQIAANGISGASLVADIDLGGVSATRGGQQLVSQAAQSVHGSPTGLSILRGRVDSTGSPLNGEGYSAGFSGPSTYTITYTTPFVNGAPTVLCTAESTGVNVAVTQITANAVTGFTVVTRLGGGATSAATFNFLVIGFTT